MPATFNTSVILSILAFIPSSVLADNWPQWRGPAGNGISTEGSIPVEWSSSTNVRWRTPMPGQGGATPVVWDDRLFVTSAEGADLVLICLNTDDGRLLWKKTVTTGNQNARAGEGNSASPSPSTDGQHVWVFFSTGVLACYDFDGNEVWKFDVDDRFGKVDIQFGMTSTPVLDGDHLYLQLIHGAMDRGDDTRTGKVIKLDKLSGKTIWEYDRVTEAFFECKHSYASPFMYDDGKQKFLVVHGADCTTGHNLATGQEIWRFAGLNGPSAINRKNVDTFRFVSSPAIAAGRIIIPTAKSGPTVAVKVDDSLRGLRVASEQATQWFIGDTPDVSIPLVVDGFVYLLHKNGKLQCLALETGKEFYHERTNNAEHRASPIYADGHLYFCGKNGICTVVKVGPKFEVVAYNAMQDEPITASPIVANGTLYIRTYAALYAIGH